MYSNIHYCNFILQNCGVVYSGRSSVKEFVMKCCSGATDAVEKAFKQYRSVKGVTKVPLYSVGSSLRYYRTIESNKTNISREKMDELTKFRNIVYTYFSRVSCRISIIKSNLT